MDSSTPQQTPPSNPSPAPQPVVPQPATPASLPPSPTTPVSTPPKSNKTSIIAALVLLVIVIVGIVVLTASNKNQIASAQPVADKFIADLKSDNPTDAYSLTDSSFQKSYGEAQVAADFDVYKSDLNNASSAVVAKGDNKYSQVALVYKISGDSTIYTSLILQQDKGHWAVLSYYTSSKPLSAFRQ